MKRTLVILLLLVLTVSLVACGGKDGAPDGMVDAAVDNAKFHLFVPDTWTVQEGVSSALAADGISNVMATQYLFDTQYTPVTYWENKAKPLFEKELAEFTVIEAECGETTLGGLNAQKYVFTAKVGGITYKYQQVILTKGNIVYTLQYTAYEMNYANHLADVDRIRNEFTLR